MQLLIIFVFVLFVWRRCLCEIGGFAAYGNDVSEAMKSDVGRYPLLSCESSVVMDETKNKPEVLISSTSDADLLPRTWPILKLVLAVHYVGGSMKLKHNYSDLGSCL